MNIKMEVWLLDLNNHRHGSIKRLYFTLDEAIYSIMSPGNLVYDAMSQEQREQFIENHSSTYGQHPDNTVTVERLWLLSKECTI